MRNILKIGLIAVSAILFSVYAIIGALAVFNNENSSVAAGDKNKITDESLVEVSMANGKYIAAAADNLSPRAGATQAEAGQTVLTTDKTAYKYDEIAVLTIKPLYDNDFLAYGHHYVVQYYDTSTGEWKNSEKDYSFTEEGIEALGKGTEKYKISDRLDKVADKYRITFDIYVNGFPVKLVSNEFTVQF